MARSNVVLPQPDGPTIEVIVLLVIFKFKLSIIINSSLFNINSWGTSTVLMESIKKIDFKKSIYYLPKLNDIDNEQDLNKHSEIKSLI